MDENRLEILRHEIYRLIRRKQPEKIVYFVSHLYGVARFAALLAKRRNLNAELATTCGMLHDIYQITAGTIENHAVMGAIEAEDILRILKLHSDEEIEIITAAISRHSDKLNVHGQYDELLKDADILDHCLSDPDFPVHEKEIFRYKNLLAELGCNPVE
jgi:HD superfamily phosphodiesterase